MPHDPGAPPTTRPSPGTPPPDRPSTPDVGGPDVGGPDVGGPHVPAPPAAAHDAPNAAPCAAPFDAAATPLADPARLDVLEATGLVAASAVAQLPTFDHVARLAALATRAPLAQVNLITADAQIPAATFVADGAVGPAGVPIDPQGAAPGGAWRTPVPLDASFCRHVVADGDPVVIADATCDARTAASRATTDAGVRAYAAAPLVTPGGHVLGTVCVVDFVPRAWSDADRAALDACAALAGEEVAARLGAARALRAAETERERLLAAERAARAEAERERRDLAAVLEVVPVGIGIARDPACREIQTNPALARQLGVRAGENPSKSGPASDGLPFVVRQHGRELRPDELPMQRAAREGHPLHGELYEIVHDDGRVVQLLEYAVPLRDADGRVRGAVGAFVDVTERERLLAAEQAARSRADALQRATAALSAARTVAEVAEALVAHGVRASGAPVGSVVLLDAARTHFTLAASLGVPDAVRAAAARFPADAPIPARDAVRTGAPVVHATGAAYRAAYPAIGAQLDALGVEASYVLPLATGPGAPPFGVVSFAFHTPQAFDDAVRAFYEALAQLGAQALERARLFAGEQAARRRAERLRTLAGLLAGARTAADVGCVLAEEGGRAFGATSAGVALLEAGGASFTYLALSDGTPTDVRRSWQAFPSTPDTPYGVVVANGTPLYLAARAEAIARFPAIAPALELQGLGAMAVLPLVADDGHVFGALHFAHAEDRAHDPDEREAFEAVAREGARALERARLFEAEHAARAEAERARAAADVERRRAEEANAAKGQFLTNMSHELRTPLNAIGGYAQLLEMGLHGPVTDDQREALLRVQRAQQHLLGLINDVLNFAKLDAGRVAFACRAAPLADVVAEAVLLVEPQCAAKGLTLAVHGADADAPWAWVDPEKLAQVLLNLLSNAIKFTPAVQGPDAPAPGAPGRIDVEVGAPAADATVVAVRVRDTGIGIAADKREAIFEPFVQVNAGLTRAHEGTGLGLAISRDLARGMGGELAVEGASGAGSTFVLTLRRATADGDGPVAPTATPGA